MTYLSQTPEGSNRLTLRSIWVERYVKPINIDWISCDTTKDFLICALTVNYPEAFDKDQKQYRTMLFVWARINGKYEWNGGTYRMEALGELEPRGAFSVWDYNQNAVVMVKEFDVPKVIKVEQKINIGLKKGIVNKRRKLQVKDLDLRLRANRFTDSKYEVIIKGEDYATFCHKLDPDHHSRPPHYYTLLLLYVMLLLLSPVPKVHGNRQEGENYQQLIRTVSKLREGQIFTVPRKECDGDVLRRG